MRQVAVIGVGQTRYGKQPEKSIRELGEEAVFKAVKDARISPKEVEVAYCGHVVGKVGGQELGAGHLILEEVGITQIPITRIENGCASGSFAFRQAWQAVAYGICDVALAIGVEKMSGRPTQEVLRLMEGASDGELEVGITYPGIFALIAMRHMAQYETTLEQMAMVAVKNRKNASMNPTAHFQKEVGLEEVLSSRLISYPITLYECCPMTDGCAAAVLTTVERAQSIKDSLISVRASAHATGTYSDAQDITTMGVTRRAARQAYEMAGLGPEDIDLVEVHDCFAIAEIVHSEDLGFCPKGKGGQLVEEGHTQIDGKIPISPSGGLLAKGHPLGATGLGQIVEIIQQLRGGAGPRQVKNASIGLAHCLGGGRRSIINNCSITILERER